jgi:hypothetical protein
MLLKSNEFLSDSLKTIGLLLREAWPDLNEYDDDGCRNMLNVVEVFLLKSG